MDTSNCVHCGLCLSSCPTYQATGLEAESPRGRVLLLRQIAAEPSLLDERAFRYLDDCLDCRACEAVCPSHVPTGHLVEQWRAETRTHSSRSGRVTARALRLFLGSRGGLRWLQRIARWSRSSLGAAILRRLPSLAPPGALRLQAGLPRRIPSGLSRDQIKTKPGNGEGPVMLFVGCVMDAVYAETNERTADLLALSGAQILVPKEQACCGALHFHAGDAVFAQELARRNIEAFEASGARKLIVNAAGCGAFLREYGDLFEDDPLWHGRALRFQETVEDVLTYAVRAQLPQLAASGKTVTVHDACHHVHAQGIRKEPRELLRRAGYSLQEMPSSDRCCGAAGSYSITHPEMAGYLLERKIADIPEGVGVIAAANPGCSMHIQAGIAEGGRAGRVDHPVSLAWEAYRAAGYLGGRDAG